MRLISSSRNILPDDVMIYIKILPTFCSLDRHVPTVIVYSLALQQLSGRYMPIWY